MTQTRSLMPRLLAAGMISVFALSLAAGPAAARGGAGDGRNDPFVESFKASSQTRTAKPASRAKQSESRRPVEQSAGSSEGPNFFERLFGASAKDGAAGAQSQ